MKAPERKFLAAVLFVVITLVIYDLITDYREGSSWWHLAVETLMGICAGVGFAVLIRGSFNLKHELENERKLSSELRGEADAWKKEAKKHIDGLSKSIDYQLEKWKLTSSEKEIAFLLLKGLSLKEIADIRQTSEKTVRTQATSLYSKSGVAGRSELSAFFLEDLLLPKSEQG